MSDSEESVVPDAHDQGADGYNFGQDFAEAGIIQKVELINFMCHAYVSLFSSLSCYFAHLSI
jgi:hypothetical protein